MTAMAVVSIVESMNTNNTGPNSSEDPSTQNPQDTGEHEGQPPPDAEEASGGVADSSEPVVDPPDQGNVELQDAMRNLVESAQYLLGYIIDKRSQGSDAEPANIAYGAVFYDDSGQGCGSMGEYAPVDIHVAETKKQDQTSRGFGLGMSLGAAITAAGVNALSRDMLWLLGGFAEKMGGSLRSAFGSKHPSWPIPRPPTSGDFDVTRMPTQEPWGSFVRVAAPEASDPGVAASGPTPEAEFMKKVSDLKEKVESGTENHEDVVDIFKHFEELFGDVFGKKL